MVQLSELEQAQAQSQFGRFFMKVKDCECRIWIQLQHNEWGVKWGEFEAIRLGIEHCSEHTRGEGEWSWLQSLIGQLVEVEREDGEATVKVVKVSPRGLEIEHKCGECEHWSWNTIRGLTKRQVAEGCEEGQGWDELGRHLNKWRTRFLSELQQLCVPLRIYNAIRWATSVIDSKRESPRDWESPMIGVKPHLRTPWAFLESGTPLEFDAWAEKIVADSLDLCVRNLGPKGLLVLRQACVVYLAKRLA